MPIGWITVLQAVPWAEVIKAAPQVAEGAKKLWSTVTRKPPPPALPLPSGGSEVDMLRQRLESLEASVNELQAQMLASSELIKALADQNGQLIQRAEVQRRRLLILLVLILALGALALAGWWRA